MSSRFVLGSDVEIDEDAAAAAAAASDATDDERYYYSFCYDSCCGFCRVLAYLRDIEADEDDNTTATTTSDCE